MTQEHQGRILDQFTRQAQTFGAVKAHASEDALRLLADAVRLAPSDRVLDVACGPGIVACDFARTASAVTGIDVVPAMIEEARKRQQQAGLLNIEWRVGDVTNLPFRPEEFSLVVTRYSFHHFLEPRLVLTEMMRVCQRNGRIAVCDVTPEAKKAEAYDEIETLRDPSHVHALPLENLKAVAVGMNCELLATEQYFLEISLEEQLKASFTSHADQIREKMEEDLATGKFGVNAFRRGTQIWYRLPISILVWRKN